MATLDPSLPTSPGAEPAWCPSCDLQHTRRPDWLCPRCGMPVETSAALIVDRPRRRGRAADAEAAAAPEDFPAGSLVAGGVLAATSLVLAIAFARHPIVAHRWPLVAAMVLLAVFGFELLIKVSPARWMVAAAGILAALVAAEDLVRARWPALTRDPLPPALRAWLRDLVGALSPLQLLLASGLVLGTLLLVVGRPGRARMAAAAVIAAPLAAVEAVRAFVR